MKPGAYGEKQGCEYLKNLGYTILVQNFRCKQGEIDIVATENGVLHFVEVKTRSNQSYGLPCEAVSAQKIKRIVKSGEYYIWLYDLYEMDVQIDIIEILDGDIHFMENVVFL